MNSTGRRAVRQHLEAALDARLPAGQHDDGVGRHRRRRRLRGDEEEEDGEAEAPQHEQRKQAVAEETHGAEPSAARPPGRG
ncbi:MAG: hypothetical protein WDN72_07250 [Alphaproteobacteria bacterium]